ncbi:hypothetical protein ABZ951_13345 [Streptomyces sp. NPDC046215]|uniref:Transglutaminase-like domain-containing protein n=1 Tax=Streptomyces stramineus TaxID=173861 RepID=A0ABP3JSQ6_9ACTN
MTDTTTGDDGWRRALVGFVPVPAAHARPELDASAARHLLRCTPTAWSALTTGGLTPHPTADGERFDSRDLFNLAVHSGSRASVPELALSLALRFARQDPRHWARERTWDLELTLTCPRHEGEGTWHAWPPVPCDAPAGPGEPLRRTGPDAAWTLRHRARTRGLHARLSSPRLRAETAAELARPLRYARMPAALRADPGWMAARGLVDCVSGTLALGRRLTAAGFAVRTRTGWLVGPQVSAHTWLEVHDDDGRWKCVDVAHHHLARTLFGAGAVAPESFAGSRPDRLVPTAAPAGEELFAHRCRAAGPAPDARISAVSRPGPPDRA